MISQCGIAEILGISVCSLVDVLVPLNFLILIILILVTLWKIK